MAQRENAYQAGLIKRIEKRFPGSVLILKNDSGLRQGILDLTLLFSHGFWAMLEVKTSEHAPHQPNQDWYVQKIGEMSYTAFIFPENEEAVLDAIEQEFQYCRQTRLS